MLWQVFRTWIGCALVATSLAMLPLRTSAASDLYLRDTPTDLGVEPNTVSTAFWATEDIWVRQTPDPGYQPYASREAAPSWTPLPHQNPLYRPLEQAQPNYVYVRVRNRGNTASTGNERLRVYMSKSGSSPRWPSQWVDHLVVSCGVTNLQGIEITKPRLNAAKASAAEREAYVRAIRELASSPQHRYADQVSHWHKLAQVYRDAPPEIHHSPAFAPWHREFLQRFELLLQASHPTLRLMYWDWTTDPSKGEQGFDLFTAGFMGNSGRGTEGVRVGAPMEVLEPPLITRALGLGAPPTQSDATLLAATEYPAFRVALEQGNQRPVLGYVGGGGNLTTEARAVEDPFFFLINANSDRLWAQWQRTPGGSSRIDPLTAYGSESGHPTVQQSTLAPWDGAQNLFPWTLEGGEITAKTAKDASILSPPIYDTAPLTVPVLQPGEAVVLQIPWYPPNPAALECEGISTRAVSILARVETEREAPFGMTSPETEDVNANVRNNNNVAMKTVEVVDDFGGSKRHVEIWLRNDTTQTVTRSIRIDEAGLPGEPSFLNAGSVHLNLGSELFNRWNTAGRPGQNVESTEPGWVRFKANKSSVQNLVLQPGERFRIELRFEITPNSTPQFGQISRLDLVELEKQGQGDQIVAGRRYWIDFNKLTLISSGATWRYWNRIEDVPPETWILPEFNDGDWREGVAPLGYGEPEVVTELRRLQVRERSAAVFLRRRFVIDDPTFLRTLLLRIRHDDGVVVYLNGTEIHRARMSEGPVEPGQFATDPAQGVEELIYHRIQLDKFIPQLRSGTNLLAVAVHQAAILEGGPTVIPDEDMIFDLEFCGNPPGVNQRPYILASRPQRYSVHQLAVPVPIQAETTDVDGGVRNMIFQGDNQILISFVKSDPAELIAEKSEWANPRAGRRSVTVAAFDELGSLSFLQIPISIVNNLPPSVSILEPKAGAQLETDQPLTVIADPVDLGGSVTRVDVLLRKGDSFAVPQQLLGTISEPPFIWEQPPLDSGIYTVQVRAVDNLGLESVSIPVRFTVAAPENILLRIEAKEGALVLSWDSPSPTWVLQESSSPVGPWETLTSATSPWLIRTETATARFYRLATTGP